MAAPNAALRALAAALPKADLHRHLSGSLRDATLAELTAASPAFAPGTAGAAHLHDALAAPSRSLSDCFRIFDAIHAAVRDHAALARITAEAIDDAAADNLR
jgi:adenosine deaminase